MAQNYVLLERIELNASAASVTFSNIPQTGYTDLKIVFSARNNAGATIRSVQMRFNNSSSNIYSAKIIDGNGSSASSAGYANDVIFYWAGWANDTNSTANTFSNCEIYIPNYTSSNYKSVSMDAVAENNATTAYTRLEAGLWASTAAITEVNIIGESSFLAGSTFSLYGLAAVGTTPVTAPKADGGNVIATDGTYWYHAFLSNGTFTPQVGLSCDYLVVAGGGGGGTGTSPGGGGGGAGGLRSTVTATGGGGSLETALTLSASTGYAITVGAGGASDTSGSNSVFSTITSIGGGRGGSSSGAGAVGGSGGGGSTGSTPQSAAAGTANQGYAGGSTTTTPQNNYGSAGGGGAAAVGGNGTTSNGGAGGAGVAISAFATATNTGVSNYYAGGGGGGCGQFTGANGGAGGSGGGGTGGSTNGRVVPTIGTANTGGGGGGAFYEGSSGVAGAAGGSGIVIVRYLVA